MECSGCVVEAEASMLVQYQFPEIVYAEEEASGERGARLLGDVVRDNGVTGRASTLANLTLITYAILDNTSPHLVPRIFT